MAQREHPGTPIQAIQALYSRGYCDRIGLDRWLDGTDRVGSSESMLRSIPLVSGAKVHDPFPKHALPRFTPADEARLLAEK